MKRIQCLLVAVLAAFGYGCAEKKPDFDPSVVMKIIVRADGSVLVDGATTPLSEVPGKLATHRDKKGVVWYYRANPDGEPSPNAMAVLKMIMNARRPLQLFIKEDFSVGLDGDGKPIAPK
jgi:hypothetical protein